MDLIHKKPIYNSNVNQDIKLLKKRKYILIH